MNILTQNASHCAKADRRAAAGLFIAFFCFYLIATAGHLPYGDEAVYLSVAEGILVDGRPIIPVPSGGSIRYEFSKFDLGQSLLELPFMAAARLADRIAPALRTPALSALPALACALLAAFVFLFARLPGPGGPLLTRGPALALAAATGIASQLWPASQTHFADTSASTLLVAAIYLLASAHALGGPAARIVVAGLCLGAAFLCKSVYLAALPAPAIFVVWSLRRKRTPAGRTVGILAAAALPVLAAAATHLWYNHLRYGGVFSSGYSQGRDGALWFATPLWVGIYGILFSAGRGFFFYSPLCLLALAGFPQFFRRRRPELLLIAGAAIPLLLIYAKWWSWGGGWEWGTRFHLFMVPLLAWISAPAWRRIGRQGWRIAVLAALLAWGVCVQLLGVLIHPAVDWAILAQETEIQRRVFRPEELEMTRDGSLLGHFIPECSPIAAHAWLVWATLNRDRLTERELALASPYADYDPLWAPARVAPYLGFNPWAMKVWRDFPDRNGSAAALLALLFAGLAAGAGLAALSARARRCDAPRSGSPSGIPPDRP